MSLLQLILSKLNVIKPCDLAALKLYLNQTYDNLQIATHLSDPDSQILHRISSFWEYRPHRDMQIDLLDSEV